MFAESANRVFCKVPIEARAEPHDKVSRGGIDGAQFNRPQRLFVLYQMLTVLLRIMREDDRRSVFQESGFDDLARMDSSSIDGAPKQHLQIADNAVARV